MSFPNQPRVLRGAFVEYGVSVPPLFVIFQFNPEKITRTRSASFAAPGAGKDKASEENRSFLTRRCLHKKGSDLEKVRELQAVTVKEESISFDIRLDATDGMNEGDSIATEYGIAPQLATLELMMYPKSMRLLAELLRDVKAFTFTGIEKPPVILFIWGRNRVLPVNLTNMSIVEEEFSTGLNPIRATVSVSMEVIEGASLPYLYTHALREIVSALNLRNVADLEKIIIS